MTEASRKSKSKAEQDSSGSIRTTRAERSIARQKDVVLVHGTTEDGAFRVLRKRGEQLFVGEMRAVQEGKPLVPGGEVVTLRPRTDSPQLFDAETLYRVPGGSPASAPSDGAATSDAPAALAASSDASDDAPTTVGGGPAQVSTPAYREGWGAIFGTRGRRGGPHTLN